MNKKEILIQFGENVKVERIRKKLTQQQLSEIMNVSINYLSNIENGKQNMSLGKVLELANYLQTDINNLLEFKKD